MNAEETFQEGLAGSWYEGKKLRPGTEQNIIKFIDSLDFEMSEKAAKLNVPFWIQAQKFARTLMWDDPEKVYYPTKAGNLITDHQEIRGFLDMVGVKNPKAASLEKVSNAIEDGQDGLSAEEVIPLILKNYTELQTVINQLRDKLIPIIESGEKAAIFTNHCSWGNIPVLDYMLAKALDIEPRQINTIVGTAILTQKETFEVIISLSNLFETLPATIYGNVIEEDLAKELRGKFLRTLISFLKNKEGGLVVMCASGTTDRMIDGALVQQDPTEGSFKLIDLIARYTEMMIAIGTEIRSIFPENQHMQVGSGQIGISDPWDGVESTKDWLKRELSHAILDEKGNSIGSFDDFLTEIEI